MKTMFYERTFPPDFIGDRSLWQDTVDMGFNISTHPDNIWGVLRLSTADGEKAKVLYKGRPENKSLGNEAVMRIRWYSESHFWISEATELPENVCLEIPPVDGHLRASIERDDKQADFALAFAVRQNGSESIWAVWGFLEDGDTLDDIQNFFERFGGRQ